MPQNGLLDFLQGASNSAASNVSAPIDGINWLLRKAGLPVSEKPFLGSDWMAAQGLTREPQNRNMGLLGEAIGGVLPMVAAAKAPQIARGLLQGAENMAAPRMLNPQAGAIGPGISDAERAARMESMGMERGWYRGGDAPNAAGNRTGPWYTQDAEEAAGYAKRTSAKDVREYALPQKGFLQASGGYPSKLAHDVAKIVSSESYGKDGAYLAKQLQSYGPNEPVSGAAIWQSLESRFGNDGAAEVLQKLGFNGAKGITGGPEAYVFKSAPVRDANKAAFISANRGNDDIFGKASLPFLGLVGGTALGADYLLHKD
jgi:hypothetical protein